MTDAQLLYDACLRAERRIEVATARETSQPTKQALMLFGLSIIQTLREEIGRGLAEREGG
jgi:hypothetical protein